MTITLACAVVGLLYAFLAPKWYRSVVTVMPVKSQRGGDLASILGGEAAGLAAGFLDGAAGGADAVRVAAVLQSLAVTDAVIGKFDLRTRYEEKYLETAREALWRHCDVKTLAKPQLVQLSCEDKDPEFVQQLLAYFAEYGNQVFRRVSVTSASEEVRFLERRVAELRQQADDAARRMREFQEQHKIVDLDTQAKAVVSALAALNTQRISKQLELDYQRTFSSRDEPSLRQLQSQIQVMQEQQRNLEDAPAGTSVQAAPVRRGTGLFPSALEVPKLRAEFENLYRDRRVTEATLVFALERFEAAKANEARDVSTFAVLDPPTLPTRKSRPKRLLIVAMFSLAGLCGALAFAWFANAREIARGAPRVDAGDAVSRRVAGEKSR
jgi:capsule polysaccharide export protein KpsE/RkpR